MIQQIASQLLIKLGKKTPPPPWQWWFWMGAPHIFYVHWDIWCMQIVIFDGSKINSVLATEYLYSWW